MKQTITKLRNLFVYRPIVEKEKVTESFGNNTIFLQPEIPTEWIAERAFYIWQERGCSHGNDREDWLLARFQLEDELN